MEYDIYTGLLESFNEFIQIDYEFETKYILNEDIITELRQKYNLDKVAGDGNDLSKILRLLYWVTGNIYHNGSMMSNYDVYVDSISLLNHSFGKNKEYGLNCVFLSYVLVECCLAVDIKAKPLFMMPMSPYDDDNHVVVIAFDSQNNKWIMIDPTYGSFLSNKNGTILNPLEIRSMYAKQNNPEINNNFSYNHIKGKDLENIRTNYHTYMAKNSFSYITFDNIIMGRITSTNNIYICPKGFNIKKRSLSNLEYRVKKYGSSDWTKNRLIDLESRVIRYTNFDEVMSK